MDQLWAPAIGPSPRNAIKPSPPPFVETNNAIQGHRALLNSCPPRKWDTDASKAGDALWNVQWNVSSERCHRPKPRFWDVCSQIFGHTLFRVASVTASTRGTAPVSCIELSALGLFNYFSGLCGAHTKKEFNFFFPDCRVFDFSNARHTRVHVRDARHCSHFP